MGGSSGRIATPDADLETSRGRPRWAVTLRLVETAVLGGRATRSGVIRSLSGRHGNLHDYLAEEVIGRMPADCKRSWNAAPSSTLRPSSRPRLPASLSTPGALDVTEEAGCSLAAAARWPAASPPARAPSLSCWTRWPTASPDPPGSPRSPGQQLVARWPPCGGGSKRRRRPVLAGSLESILGAGGAQAAVDLIAAGGVPDDGGWAQALAARAFLREGDIGRARDAADRALISSTRGDPTISLTVALATLTTVEVNAGEYRPLAAERRETPGPYLECRRWRCRVRDRWAAASRTSRQYGSAQRLGHLHYLGIAHLNLACRSCACDLPPPCGARGLRSTCWHRPAEMDTVRTAPPGARAATRTLCRHRRGPGIALPQRRFETLLEAADVVGLPDPDAGRCSPRRRPSRPHRRTDLPRSSGRDLNRLGCCTRPGALDSIADGRHTGYPGFYVRVKLSRAVAALLAGSVARRSLVAAAKAQAELQGAAGTLRALQLLESLDEGQGPASSAVAALWSVEPGIVTAHAEAVLAHLGSLDESALAVVGQAASRQPSRWRRGLRSIVETGPARGRWAAGRILDAVGERSDVRRLRALSRELKGPYRAPLLGRDLARRTADRVWVEDQGRVIVRVGGRFIQGSEMRRKPLALLCLLLSRPGMSATRDQVLDALWPDTDPDQAVNSLHQTVYFLRRVIEPSYSDDLSPGYLNQDTELIWLDSELIASRSVRCREQMRSLGPEPPVPAVLALAGEYRGKFALDFLYDDWASMHRDSLHAQYLEVMERAIAFSAATGRFTEAMELALLGDDPSSVDGQLVKIYRLLGAHAAAAEQYQHYTTVVREANRAATLTV
jgi:DNA-binding SARP family transcriptional activator